MNCLMCGRCTEVCPVGIDTDNLRLVQRSGFATNHNHGFGYLTHNSSRKAEVVYFAGCMTRLTPGITKSMKDIFQTAGIDFLFLDEGKTICCGRPLMLAGKDKQAQELVESNRKMIRETSAKILVTSCPICLRTFREDYQLDMEVLHHSQYLLRLIKKGKLPIQSDFKRIVYHDPCELGRGLGIFAEPRELLGKVADVIPGKDEKEFSLCCGGSLGILNMDFSGRNEITKGTLSSLMAGDPETIVTGCPLCKKTLAKYSPVKVLDIAEMVSKAIPVLPKTAKLQAVVMD